MKPNMLMTEMHKLGSIKLNEKKPVRRLNTMVIFSMLLLIDEIIYVVEMWSCKKIKLRQNLGLKKINYLLSIFHWPLSKYLNKFI